MGEDGNNEGGRLAGMMGGDASRAGARIRVRAHTSFCRILSDSVEFCRRRVGALQIVDCGLMIGNCKMSPWATVWLEWPWV